MATHRTLPMSLFGKLSYRCDKTIAGDYDESETYFQMMHCASNIIEEKIKTNTELENDFRYVKLISDRINCGKDYSMVDTDAEVNFL